MHKGFHDTDFWIVPRNGHSIAHLAARNLIWYRATGNVKLYNSTLNLIRVCMK